MNERIEKLIDRAEHYATQQAGSDWEVHIPYDEKVFRQKFAELIVQECVNVLHDNELWNRHISHALNEHFGVEE